MIIQTLLIVVVLMIAYSVISNRNTHKGKAWKKIGLLLFILCMILTVLFPGLIDVVAHTVGVGRGADLLLYMLAVAFVFYVLNSYLYQQDQRDKIYSLARKIALIESKDLNKTKNS